MPTPLPTSSAPVSAPPTQWLSVDGGRIAFDDSGGPGPLVLAVPGMGDLRHQYRALRPLLVQAGYRVVTMDVRGFGESTARWAEVSARAVGRDVLRLVAHLQAGPAVVMGNSFAAGSALWAAREAPQQVSGAVLLGPIVRDAPPNRWMEALVRVGFAGPWRVWFWMSYWRSLFPLQPPPDHAEAAAALAANLREPGRMDTLRAMVALSKRDTEALVADSRVPALVVMGTRDADFKDAPAEARWLVQALSAPCVLVEGAGHYPHLEQAGQVMVPLLDFLRRVTGRP